MPLIMFVSSSFNTYVNLPKKKGLFSRQLLKLVFLYCFRFLQYIYNMSNIFGCCSIVLHTLFLFLFEFSFSFIFWINSLTTHETIIVVLFFLLFVFLLLLESYTPIWTVLPKLVSVSQELKEGEMRGKT